MVFSNAPVLPGLSPRVRGNLGHSMATSRCKRSIPACAGEPCQRRARQPWCRVYPRVCGGTMGMPSPERGRVYVCGGTTDKEFTYGDTTGLSPRVRGNLGLESPFALPKRSIPACAGEPSDGGTTPVIERSIPACAGEPFTAWVRCQDSTVYPRVCGGTSPSVNRRFARTGLSPRVRGNHA